MKNPHGVEPTRFMKRKESEYAIKCNQSCGPQFGDDITMEEYCYDKKYCIIYNNGSINYECHPQYKSSLYVNSAGPNETNHFNVLDYEVYGIDYKDKDNIYKICQYPDAIWEYITTDSMSDETLKQFDNELSLLKDLDRIHCTDDTTKSNITNYFFKEKSELFPTTNIITRQYDKYLKKWIGRNKYYKKIYQVFGKDFSAKYHNHCDMTKPKVIIIRTTEGYIFGGYLNTKQKQGILSIVYYAIYRWLL